jgi:hypothetical protein
MSGPFGATPWMYDHTDFYPLDINQSLKFNDDESQYLSWTPTAAGNRKTWTWSGWVKRGNISFFQALFASHSALNDAGYMYVGFNGDDTLSFATYSTFLISTTQVFRDTSSWYHFVFSFDATQATASNRLKLYVNGVEVTSFSDDNRSSISNTNYAWNQADKHFISGRYVNNWASPIDGYLSDVHFIDGQALDPTSFGEFKESIWIPKVYNGTYGTNGFHLEFNSNTNDASGNGNNWTANNISAHNYVTDSPTNNFAVMSSIHPSSSNFTISDGNLSLSKSGTGTFGLYSQSLMPTTGKWYFETCITGRGTSDRTRVGLANYNSVTGTSTIQSSYSGVEISTAVADKVFIVENGSTTENDTFYTALSDNDVVRFAVDMDNGRLYIGVNGNWWNYNTSQTGGDPTSGSGYVTNSTTIFDGSPMTAYSGFSAGLTTSTGQTFNFGQDSTFSGATTAGGNTDGNGKGDFKHPVPNGFLALCTANLPTPSIVDGSDYFNTVLYTGTGATRSITGVGFQPDWVWIKSRDEGTTSYTGHNVVQDSVRGVGTDTALVTNETYSEAGTGYSDAVTAFNSDGFSLGSRNQVNYNTDAFVAWNWKAGGTAVSNTDGSITSQVSANVDAGFSIVSYTGTGVDGDTVGHGLTASEPELVIIKGRTGAGYPWAVYGYPNNSAFPNDGSVVYLNDTAAMTDSTGSELSLGASTISFVDSGANINGSGQDYICYAFHSVEGYSKAGSYTGNGSTDGPFVYTGFKPAWILVKRSSGVEHWKIFDSTRDTFNAVHSRIHADESNAEYSGAGYETDFVANGFKIRTATSDYNTSGGTYIYLAFAENPFKYSNAR